MFSAPTPPPPKKNPALRTLDSFTTRRWTGNETGNACAYRRHCAQTAESYFPDKQFRPMKAFSFPKRQFGSKGSRGVSTPSGVTRSVGCIIRCQCGYIWQQVLAISTVTLFMLFHPLIEPKTISGLKSKKYPGVCPDTRLARSSLPPGPTEKIASYIRACIVQQEVFEGYQSSHANFAPGRDRLHSELFRSGSDLYQVCIRLYTV